MSTAAHRDGRPNRGAIIRLMEKEAVRNDIPLDIFWARIDSLFQLTPAGDDRDSRTRDLCAALPNWLRSVSFQEQDLEQYDYNMMAGVYLKAPRKLSLVLLQIGSLGAKILWGDPRNARMTAEQMYSECIETLKNSRAFRTLTERHCRELKTELRHMIRRYTDDSGKCREIVRTFFRAHSKEYTQALELLTRKLIVPDETQMQAEEVQPEVPVQAAPAPEQELAPEFQETQVAKEALQVTQPAPADDTVQLNSQEYLQIMEQLKRIETAVVRSAHKADEFDDDVSGLCRFIEKTGSYLYHRSLSRLYELYSNMPERVSVKELEMILRSFFNALRTLEIEPIDEKRLEEDFPEEYREEIAGRKGKNYRFTTCGWSYRDSMVIAPQFEEEKKNEYE